MENSCPAAVALENERKPAFPERSQTQNLVISSSAPIHSSLPIAGVGLDVVVAVSIASSPPPKCSQVTAILFIRRSDV